MNKEQEEQLKEEIAHIFQNGPNKERVFEMVKMKMDIMGVEHNKKMLKKNKPAVEMAFPSEMPRIDNPNFVSHEGMTMRDFFASKVIPSTINRIGFSVGKQSEWHAKKAYEVADEMMKERSKTKE